jgi:chlorobactene glucosyltransferase
MLFFSPKLMQVLHVLFVLGALYFFLLAGTNILWLRLSSRKPRRKKGALVSVLIPARNEEQNIGRCLDSLLNQSYLNYEIIVLDDRSTDRTWEIVSGYAARHPGLIRAVQGKRLPQTGWHGKPHAMQQLGEQARGEYLIFTDADTVHSPDSISWAVTNIEWHRVDFLSGYVAQEIHSLGEALIVPAMYIMTAIIMPIWLIAATRTPLFSFAIGQLVVFRRQAFQAVRGYSRVSVQISDDISIAREIKKAGMRTIFLDIQKHVSCRMYKGYWSAFNGLGKNVTDFLNRKLVSMVSASLAILFLFVLPYALLPLYILEGNPSTQLTAISVVLFQLTWCSVVYDRGLKWYVPFLYPLMFLHVLVMMWRGYGQLAWGAGVVWKGRTVK